MTPEPDLIQLARLVERLASGQPFVTEEAIALALADAQRGPADPAALLDRAVASGLLFRDRRTLHDVAANTFREARLYRVNFGHPLFREQDRP